MTRVDVRKYATLDERKASAKMDVDAKAGDVRARFITVTAGQEGTYVLKHDEAVAHKAAGYPADLTDYPFIAADADAYGFTPQEATDAILAIATQWRGTIGPTIERERLRGKNNIDLATSTAEVRTARDTAIAALDAIAP